MIDHNTAQMDAVCELRNVDKRTNIQSYFVLINLYLTNTVWFGDRNFAIRDTKKKERPNDLSDTAIHVGRSRSKVS